jgi:hypothetical protein
MLRLLGREGINPQTVPETSRPGGESAAAPKLVIAL